MSSPGRLNLDLWAGSIFGDVWTWYTDDEETTPKDLSNYTALLHCRRRRTDTSPLLTLSSEGASPAIVLGGAAGTITATFLESLTSGLVVPSGWWGLEMTNTAPTPDTSLLLLEGAFVINPEVVF